MSVEENKALIRRLYDEVVNAGNPAALNALMAAGFVSHTPDVGAGIGGDRTGIDEFVHELAALRSMLSGLNVTIEQFVGGGDKVAVHGVTRGRHTGATLGIAPTGNDVTMTWTAIYRIADGRLAERWLNGDDLSSFQQLGLIPRQ